MKRIRRRKKNGFVDRLQAVFGGQSVTSVAIRLGIDQPAMTRYLRGEVTPGYRFFSKAAEAGVDTNWLLTGKKIPDNGIAEPEHVTDQQIHQQLAFQISQLKRSVDIDEVLHVVRSLVEFKVAHLKD